MANEVEIKFLLKDQPGLEARLREIGFRQVTARTHEFNTLYDHLGKLRSQGSLLRLRKYGDKWTLTHKGKSQNGRHKTRVETETKVADGESMDHILQSIGFEPSFRYEKFRSEWTDGEGQVVLDETPIGNIGEIEGPPDWIDRTAKSLELQESDYITKSYGELFQDWVKQNRSQARNMTYAEVQPR